jgi:uncharacterized membrane protein YdfJ with MMPL/SSD domain
MNRKSYQFAFSATRVVVMAALLSTIFFASVNPSFAAAAKKKSPAVAQTSAVDHTETQIKHLQGALKITKAQEELWITLTQVMRDNAKDMDALSKDKAENTKTINAVEHMKLHSQITEARLDQMKKFIPPFEALYSSMSDEQRKSTDTIFRTGINAKSKKK